MPANNCFKQNFYFRTRGNLTYGYGHLIRTLRLAKYLIATIPGINIFFGVDGDHSDVDFIRRQGFKDVHHCTPDNHIYELELLNNIRPSVINIDMLEIPSTLLQNFQKTGARLVLFNDLGLTYNIGDIIICPQLLHQYPNITPNQTLAPGPDFFIVPHEIINSRHLAQATPLIAKNIFVNMGGAVKDTVFKHIMESIVILAEDGFQCSFLTGFATEHKYKPLHDYITIIPGTDNFAPLLASADIALTASGYIKYETAAAGIPTLLLAIVDHQEILGETFASHGNSSKYLGNINNTPPEKIASAVNELAKDFHTRKQMTIAGSKLIDGLALHRIALFFTN